MEDKYRLIGPKQFKEIYAPDVGEQSIRELFKTEGFPSIKIGTRSYTTQVAAEEYLRSLGGDIYGNKQSV